MTHPAFEALITPKPGRTLIVGSQVYNGKEDRRKRYADCVGVDMQAGPGVDRVEDMEHACIRDWGEFAHIECMSVLEHSRKPWLLCDVLERILEPGGTIYITVPFIWRIHGYPDDYWRMSISGVKSLFTKIEWTQESYAHRVLCTAENITAARSADDWPCFARTQTCMFGHKQ